MKISVIGSGAMGILIAMKLNETEKNVSLVATKETAEEIKKRGMIIVEGITEIQNEIKIDDGISNADWHILAVKNYHLDDIIGFSGIEKIYEPLLRGKDGTEFRLVDTYAIDHGVFKENPGFQPITGKAYVGIFPGKKVIGLSKFNRMVDWIASRPQIQEEMTEQIADEIEKQTEAKGVAVVLKAKHFCMSARGVKEHDSDMLTSVVRGMFLRSTSMKTEFFSLLNNMKGMRE